MSPVEKSAPCETITDPLRLARRGRKKNTVAMYRRFQGQSRSGSGHCIHPFCTGQVEVTWPYQRRMFRSSQPCLYHTTSQAIS